MGQLKTTMKSVKYFRVVIVCALTFKGSKQLTYRHKAIFLSSVKSFTMLLYIIFELLKTLL